MEANDVADPNSDDDIDANVAERDDCLADEALDCAITSWETERRQKAWRKEVMLKLIVIIQMIFELLKTQQTRVNPPRDL